jgi:tRNA threonylcarbamoyladenosine biosynthesis protein TsaE
MPPTCTLTTSSVEETLALGERIGQLAPANFCVALHGNLGAGKTHLTRGIAGGAKVDDPSLVSSPTYVLLNIYPGPKPVFHLDAYRIVSEQDFEAVGLDEILQSQGITVIEWPEKIPHLLPADRLDILIQHMDDPNHRLFQFTATGPVAERLAGQILSGR